MNSRSQRAFPVPRFALCRLCRRLALALAVCLALPLGAAAQDGSFDLSFGPPQQGGTVYLSLPPLLTGTTRGAALRVQPDGRILVLAGYLPEGNPFPQAWLLYRLLPSGSLDPSFGDAGIVALQVPNPNLEAMHAAALEILPTGEILVAGTAADLNGTGSFAVGRRLANGARDTGFGIDGWALFDFPTIGGFSSLSAMAVGEDGTVVTSGTTSDGSGTVYATFARLTVDGALDPTFGVGGRSSADLGNPAFGNNWTTAVRLLVEPGASSAVFAGEATSSSPTESLCRAAMGRLADGLFDPSFNGTGYRLDDLAALGAEDRQSLWSVSRYADGSYLAAGRYRTETLNWAAFLAKVLPDGTHDPGWGFSGYSWFFFDVDRPSNLLQACALDGAERGVCLGRVEPPGGGSRFALSRFEGPWFDPRFGSGGTLLFPFFGIHIPTDLRFDTSGRILVVGTYDYAGAAESGVVYRIRAGLPFTDGFESGLLEAWSATNP